MPKSYYVAIGMYALLALSGVLAFAGALYMDQYLRGFFAGANAAVWCVLYIALPVVIVRMILISRKGEPLKLDRFGQLAGAHIVLGLLLSRWETALVLAIPASLITYGTRYRQADG